MRYTSFRGNFSRWGRQALEIIHSFTAKYDGETNANSSYLSRNFINQLILFISMSPFEDFKKKEKFLEDMTIFYPGISDPALRPSLTEKINLAADDFYNASLHATPSENDYHQVMLTGLARFDDVYLDTEDKERVCHYFEELMQLVGLDSSGGILNNFLYGFNPDDFAR
jgi:hypothetical protein